MTKICELLNSGTIDLQKKKTSIIEKLKIWTKSLEKANKELNSLNEKQFQSGTVSNSSKNANICNFLPNTQNTKQFKSLLNEFLKNESDLNASLPLNEFDGWLDDKIKKLENEISKTSDEETKKSLKIKYGKSIKLKRLRKIIYKTLHQTIDKISLDDLNRSEIINDYKSEIQVAESRIKKLEKDIEEENKFLEKVQNEINTVKIEVEKIKLTNSTKQAEESPNKILILLKRINCEIENLEQFEENNDELKKGNSRKMAIGF